MPTTRIVITRDGKVFIEGINYIGDQCLKDLEKIINALKAVGVNMSIEFIQLKQEAKQGQRVANYG
uniref:DUF2997 domain-containing protein n=1 Tax=Ignisphaera aggregans TaxID=334771 RepID=A0A7J2U4E1_9CREN